MGATVDLPVLFVGGNGDSQIGTPVVDGAKVVAEVVDHVRGDKLLVFKYKNKTRYRRRQGHRQDYTRLAIKEIVGPDGKGLVAEEKPRRAARPKKEPVASSQEPEAATEATVEAKAPAKPARKRAAPKQEPGARSQGPEAATEAIVEAKAPAKQPARKTAQTGKPAPEKAAPRAPRAKKAAAGPGEAEGE